MLAGVHKEGMKQVWSLALERQRCILTTDLGARARADASARAELESTRATVANS